MIVHETYFVWWLVDPFHLPGLHFSFPCAESGDEGILGYWAVFQEQLVKRSGEGGEGGGGGENEVVWLRRSLI
jgi:hypothetical protein